MKKQFTSRNFKRFRAILITMGLVLSINAAISYAFDDSSSRGTIGMTTGIGDPRPTTRGTIGMTTGIGDPRPTTRGTIGMTTGIGDPRP